MPDNVRGWTRKDGKVAITSKSGGLYWIDPSELKDAIDQGYELPSPEQGRAMERSDSTTEAVVAHIQGAARTYFGGATDWLGTNVDPRGPGAPGGQEFAKESWLGPRERHPTSFTLGEVLGYAIPGGIFGRVGKGVAQAAKIGIGKAVTSPKVLQGLSGTAGAIAEGGAIGSSNALSDIAQHRQEMTPDQMRDHFIKSTASGVAVMGAAHLVGTGVGAVMRGVKARTKGWGEPAPITELKATRRELMSGRTTERGHELESELQKHIAARKKYHDRMEAFGIERAEIEALEKQWVIDEGARMRARPPISARPSAEQWPKPDTGFVGEAAPNRMAEAAEHTKRAAEIGKANKYLDRFRRQYEKLGQSNSPLSDFPKLPEELASRFKVPRQPESIEQALSLARKLKAEGISIAKKRDKFLKLADEARASKPVYGEVGEVKRQSSVDPFATTMIQQPKPPSPATVRAYGLRKDVLNAEREVLDKQLVKLDKAIERGQGFAEKEIDKVWKRGIELTKKIHELKQEIGTGIAGRVIANTFGIFAGTAGAMGAGELGKKVLGGGGYGVMASRSLAWRAYRFLQPKMERTIMGKTINLGTSASSGMGLGLKAAIGEMSHAEMKQILEGIQSDELRMSEVEGVSPVIAAAMDAMKDQVKQHIMDVAPQPAAPSANWVPSRKQLASFSKTMRAVDRGSNGILEDIGNGYTDKESIKYLRIADPETLMWLQQVAGNIVSSGQGSKAQMMMCSIILEDAKLSAGRSFSKIMRLQSLYSPEQQSPQLQSQMKFSQQSQTAMQGMEARANG